jgi:hypothetical protein
MKKKSFFVILKESVATVAVFGNNLTQPDSFGDASQNEQIRGFQTLKP